jgi:hypothetical protein
MGDEPLPEKLYCYRLETLHLQHRHNLGMSLAWGQVLVSHQSLDEPHQVAFAALHAGGHDFMAFVSHSDDQSVVAGLGPEVERPLRLLEKNAIIQLLEKKVGGARYTLGDLFLEGRRTLAQAMLGATMERYRETARVMYEANRETMLFLRQISVPLPRVYTALAEAMLTEDIIAGLKENDSGPIAPELGELALQSRSLGLSLTLPTLRKALEEALNHDLETMLQTPQDRNLARHAGQVLDLAMALEIELDQWRAQNLLYQLMGGRKSESLSPGLIDLAQRLKLDVGQ